MDPCGTTHINLQGADLTSNALVIYLIERYETSQQHSLQAHIWKMLSIENYDQYRKISSGPDQSPPVPILLHYLMN